ncbi:hypothetical protein FJZ31_36295 [Candidatus Poribacteria bacterium]|nr:hypothetical protein [Candidatus Poribacteria bacterium]
MSTGKIIIAISICLTLTLLYMPLATAGTDVKITNIKVGSGKEYKVGDGPFDLNKKYYIDRDYVATSMPDEIKGAQWIMTANDDKSSSGADFLTFEIDKPAIVWMAHDSRGEKEKGGVPPKWLSDEFKHHPDLKIDVTDTNMGFFTLWEKEFKKGKVTLGGNTDPPATGQGSNYIVLIMSGTAQAVQLQGKLGVTWGTIKK